MHLVAAPINLEPDVAHEETSSSRRGADAALEGAPPARKSDKRRKKALEAEQAALDRMWESKRERERRAEEAKAKAEANAAAAMIS